MSRGLFGIVLAAGQSRRMGYPKPLLVIEGSSFAERVVAAMRGAVEEIVVVVGAHKDLVGPAFARLDGVRVVDNPHHQRGQLSSLKAGLQALPGDARAAMVHLADQPLVSPQTFVAVAAAYRAGKTPIVIARYAGKRGHPVVFDRSLFAELHNGAEELGARAVVSARPERVAYVDVDDPAVVIDLDTPEDLARQGLRVTRPG